VREQGAYVRQRGKRLIVTKDRKVIEDIPLIHVDQVVIEGNVQVTVPALVMLINEGIDVVFFSSHGRYRFRVESDGSRHPVLRHTQFYRMGDEAFVLEVARAIVLGKLANQRTLLQRQAQHGSYALQQGIEGIAQTMIGAQQADDLEVLRGYEGRAGAYYFAAWRELMPPGFAFHGRAFHPSPDPINALLSFAYTVMDKDIGGAIRKAQLDPYLGFFHALQQGRLSLVLDLKEEFRPILIDSMVLGLLHRGEIRPADFEWTGNEQRPVVLSEGARTLVLERYEERLQTGIVHPPTGDNTTYRGLIERQALLLRQVILGEATGYVPMVWR
ncbi:MAG: CRISPR-associated endonuclease Cas1, partial [Ardenticatenales bacterium]|nr:CRISPR-associated endonuclease Cas1 [Ardenticatenales bacterium]